jgi:AbrB family looped-hinge helix DNA binding protein
MSTIIEIDKAGRIVVPKKLRDALHLTPGTRLKAVLSGECLMLTPSTPEAQLIIENGAPLIFPADRDSAHLLTNEAVNELIAQGRLERERRFLGLEGDAGRDMSRDPLGAAE